MGEFRDRLEFQHLATQPMSTNLLANDNYSVFVSEAGTGYSRWKDLAVTRWREDPTADALGFFVFLRDVENGRVWSAGYQPSGREPERYQVSFSEERAQIIRQDGPIVSRTEILVAPNDDAEVRRISITNEGRSTREIEVTSYAEVVLAASSADAAHPAFSKMFVQTEFDADSGTLLATRRSREPAERALWMFHVSMVEGEALGVLQFETDRARFLGRGRDLRNALCIVDARPLSDTAGTVLDPIVSLRRRVRMLPGATARIAFWSGVAASRVQALAVAGKYRDGSSFERIERSALDRAQVSLGSLAIDALEARLFQRIAGAILCPDPALRAPHEFLTRNQSGPSALWAHGISGDLPIVLVQIEHDGDIGLVRQCLRAHEYWRSKRLSADLVFVNAAPDAASLRPTLEAAIKEAPARSRGADASVRGGVFCLEDAVLDLAARDALGAAARALLTGSGGSLSDQLSRWHEPERTPRPIPPSRGPGGRSAVPRDLPSLDFFNGMGGFDSAAREYVTVLKDAEWTPAPWTNVIANPEFGFLVSADGTGTTWSINAQQNQLTPWSNDPVANPPAEVAYIRDEDSGELWSATPLPIREPGSYIVRHGFGYSRFEHTSRDIASDFLQFVPKKDSIKISRLKLANRSNKIRRLSVTHYAEWVLGNQRTRTAPFIVTEIDRETRALLARNPWSADFPGRVAFTDMAGRQQTSSGDRREFLGHYGSLAQPAALLGQAALSDRVGGGLDPCSVLQTRFELGPGEETEIVMLLGQEACRADALASILKYRALDLDHALKAVTDFWDQTLGTVQVKTPDRSMDVILNGWLLYQTLVCRLWARTGFYQASGAWGYRDQLQDVMALCVAQPRVAREHILRAASRQFEAGDVQHWWLPVTDQGIKTRVSDDRIWLPFVLAHYLEVTEDFAILDEPITFLEGGPLAEDQHELFGAPKPAATASLYQHCALALDSSLAIGSHGLPLFGAGDWNDGMNRVGIKGRGESVWLGWFLHAALMRFAATADRRGDTARVSAWRKHAFALQAAIDREAWDGDWYRRGYFDDGTPLGSVASEECRIDSVAQSWAVISGAAPRERAARAMASVNAQLVSRSEGLVHLFTPPFDRTAHDPGYIKAYPPGLRENGGQYTHAAMWVTLAFAILGDGDRAAELFSLINPVNHSSTRAAIHRYKVEPYVVCADVYSAPAHIGRGGWTWYTGSAGWMYRTAIEGMLGLNLRGRKLRIDPCIPRSWPGFEVTYKHGSSRYHIAVDNPKRVSRGVVKAALDGSGIASSPCEIALTDDGTYHYARITLG
jgi:cyclic beta-1,2-glucan synthetase